MHPLWRTVRRFLKKLKIELPYDPAIPLLDIYLEKTLNSKKTCTPVFIVTLFTIAKTWKQLKCPSTDEWIKKMSHIYIYIYIYMCVCVCVYIYIYTHTHTYTHNGTLLSHKKMNEIMPFAAT